MNEQTYAGIPEEKLQAFLPIYHELCSKSLRIYGPLSASMFGHFIVFAQFLEAQFSKRLVILGFLISAAPLFLSWGLTFCNMPPPIMPKSFRKAMFLALLLYGGNTLLALILLSTDSFGGTLEGRGYLGILALVGLASLPTFTWFQRRAIALENCEKREGA